MGREVDLILATQKGSISLIKRLLGASKKGVFRNKVSPNYQDSRGYTPLHHAIMYGQREALLVLLRYGADPRISDRSGNYPLHTACQHGDYDSLQLLVEHSPIKPEIDQQNANDDTPLIITAQEGFYALVEFLLRAGANPQITNRLDQNCLELASYYGRTDVVSLLLRKVPGILDSPHSAKHTSLHFAARNGHNPILQLLLDKGAEINTTCKTGSCLHEAALHGKIETVAYLLDRDIDVYLTNSLGQTVLEAIQSLAASQCRSRIQQLISDHICLKLKFGNKRNSQSFHNGLASYRVGTKGENNASFKRSSSFNVDIAQNKGWSLSNILTECETDNSSYSAPYHKTRDLPVPHPHEDRSVQYTNEAIMYNKRLRASPDTNLHFDDDVTHAPLSIIRKPRSNLPVSLQGNGIYYYKTPSAKFHSPHSDNHRLPLEHNEQQFMNGRAESSSSDDFFRQQTQFPDLYNYSGEMGPVWFPYPEVTTGESDMDEMSLGGSSQNSYIIPQLQSKRSAPIVQQNPAHTLFSHLLNYVDDNDEYEYVTQQVDSGNPDDPSIGFPTDGSYIPLQDRPASVIGCSESIERREFLKKFARHPLANLEESTSRIAMRAGERVSFYPSVGPEAAYTSSSEKGGGEAVLESDSCNIPSFSPITNNLMPNDRRGPPPVPTRRQSLKSNQTKNPCQLARPKASLPEPLIPQPFIIRQKKNSASRAREDANPYLEPNPQVFRRQVGVQPKRRVNTYHEGDCDLTPAKYPNDVELSIPERSEPAPRAQVGRMYHEKPPPGKPRGSKGYHSGTVTSDTSRSTSPSFSDSHFKSFYSQENDQCKEPAPITSPPFFASEAFTSYRRPVVEPSSSGEDTPQFSDQDSQHVMSRDKFKMSTQVDHSRLNPQIVDKSKTLTRDDLPGEQETGWESIDNVMDMVAQISNEMESSTSTELNNSLSPSSVPDLMQSMRLPHRASLLLTNGFDDISFLAGILTQDELEEIGIEDIAEIQHILAAVNLLPAPVINSKPSSLSQWLQQIGLHHLYHLFTCKGYNTIDDVCHLWDIHLTSVLEIHQLGYRKRILYSLSLIRAASPERNFTPSESEFSSPLYRNSFFTDKNSPMVSIASVPPPPPRRDSFLAAQEFWSYYEKNSTNSYPRDSSHASSMMNGSQQQKSSHTKPKYPKTMPPPLPPKNTTTKSDNSSEKPHTLPKPALSNNIIMKYSNSFSNGSRHPATDRMAPSGEKVPCSKSSFSNIEVELKNTVDQMSTSSKETLISYISKSLQPRMMKLNSNDNRTSPSMHYGRVSQTSDASVPVHELKKDSSSLPDRNKFTISPLYQQRAEETGETLPPEMGPNRANKYYHSVMAHSSPSQLKDKSKNHDHPADNLANYYPDHQNKLISKNNKPEKKKHKFGKFRSSKKIIKQNPVYQSSGVLQGLPINVQHPSSTPQTPPVDHSSEHNVSNSISASPTSNDASFYPASDIRIRSPLVMRRETMSPNLEATENSQTDVQNLWLHPVNKLTTGCVDYAVKYLGSAVVSSLVGKETINNTCRKIKESSKRGKRVPLITLSISWKWIRLKENENEEITQEHMMHHISYSSQYMDDLRMFAFISRDKKTPKYYCNVFQSPTIEHADEVVHTLGQAFEISYQQLINVKNSQDQSKNGITSSNKNKKATVSQSSPIKFHRSQSVDDVI